jgi:polyhydroxybutyrate depolymerase
MMLSSVLPLVSMLAVIGQSLTSADHHRSLAVNSVQRTYWLQVPPQYNPQQPTPVVFLLHGLGMNGKMMMAFDFRKKSDEAGFIAVCPEGTNLADVVTVWNCGGLQIDESTKPDDVTFVARLLDEMEATFHVDPKRVYVAGLSNGGMMAHRLGMELSDRIAAIATVAGTLAVDACQPKRPVPVLHFHGTADRVVPFAGPREQIMNVLVFQSVEETIQAWVKVNGCSSTPKVESIPDTAHDGLIITKKPYGQGNEGAEVVLYVIDGGGHAWPGFDQKLPFLGKTCYSISATDLMWAFFEKHPMP